MKRIVPLLCFTWLFWLYLSPQILPGHAPAGKTTVNAELQPVKDITDIAHNVAATRLAAIQRSPPSTILPRDRLEIRLSQRQVTLYRDNMAERHYPIAIGRDGWETPTGTFKIRQMKEAPTWINPLTDAVVPSHDPKNPLGDYWIGFWTDGRNWIGFHGTPDPKTVGQAISHGCIRMYNADIRELFYRVSPGMLVVVKK